MRSDHLPFDSDTAGPAELRAMTEMRWMEATELDREAMRTHASDLADELREQGVDLANPDQVDDLWQGWAFGQQVVGWFVPLDCTEIEPGHLMYHFVRAMQYSAVLLLLASEPDLPDPEHA